MGGVHRGRLAVATIGAVAVVLSSPFIGELRASIRAAFPTHFQAIVSGAVAIAVVVALTAAVVHPREVFSPAVRESAAAVILVHNHPTGDPAPSREDIEITRRLREAGDLMGIKVLDHIIIGDGVFLSFAAQGMM